MSVLETYKKNTLQLNCKIEETLQTVKLLKETLVKLKQYERAAQFRDMEIQLEQIKKEVVDLIN